MTEAPTLSTITSPTTVSIGLCSKTRSTVRLSCGASAILSIRITNVPNLPVPCTLEAFTCST